MVFRSHALLCVVVTVEPAAICERRERDTRGNAVHRSNRRAPAAMTFLTESHRAAERDRASHLCFCPFSAFSLLVLPHRRIGKRSREAPAAYIELRVASCEAIAAAPACAPASSAAAWPGMARRGHGLSLTVLLLGGVAAPQETAPNEWDPTWDPATRMLEHGRWRRCWDSTIDPEAAIPHSALPHHRQSR